ncbi:APC family permease [Phenylobacterium sp.]|uniref:APC family permease n=1 Tax=Phenylobacterium sp. TaxID=1871053 RepID=UPI0025F969E5|nr:APC family permease [Phenylobacterium sp.]
MAEVAPSQLMRVLRRRDLVGILLNAMIGAGMLAAPAKVYALAGDWSFVVLASAAAILIPLVLCFADLGSRFSGTGGAYLYARAALPPYLAFAVGWLLWLSQALSVATLANLLVTYLGGFFPALEAGWGRISVLIVLGVVLTSIVLAGIRQSAGASNLLIVIKVAFVLAFLAAGVAFVRPERLMVDQPPPDVGAFAQAILVYLFAYSGFERGAVVAGEARDPQHDVPLALLGSAVIVTFAYAAVMLICVGVLDAPAATDRPLAEAGRQLYGQTGAVLVSAGAMAVIVGTILVIIISMPRMLLSLAEHGQLPASLGRVHAAWHTPHVAILTSSALAFGFAIASDLISALTFATATRLLGYILCCIALWRLARRNDAPPALFNLPFRGPVALSTAALFTVVLLTGATKELPSLAGVLAIGFALMFLTRRLSQPRP